MRLPDRTAEEGRARQWILEHSGLLATARQFSNADEPMATVTANAESALQRIGKESPIDRRRVMQRGVAVSEPDDTGPQDQNASA